MSFEIAAMLWHTILLTFPTPTILKDTFPCSHSGDIGILFKNRVHVAMEIKQPLNYVLTPLLILLG